jgi:hypothetical protein
MAPIAPGEESPTTEELLVSELARTEYVWSNFIHYLCNNLYPERIPGELTQRFKGSKEEINFEIFKIMDHEVRHIRRRLTELGHELPQYPANCLEIFDDISKATGITTTSHKKT